MKIINDGFELVPVGQLREHERNPRQGDIGAIHESIEANGFYGAVLVQRSSGRILIGNHRYRTVVQEGAENIPVIWVDVDDDRALRIMLADNQVGDLASNDEDALTTLLKGIIEDTGTLEGTGFSGEDLDELIESAADALKFEANDKPEIVITCRSKRQQSQLLKRLEKEGLECRAR